MTIVKKSLLLRFLPLGLLLLPLFLLTGCAASSLVLETKVNDPIMMNLLDIHADLSQIEDGTGVIGEATACPT
jgi:hypothetical protein